MPIIKSTLNGNHPKHRALVDELSLHLVEDPSLPEFPKVFEAENQLSGNMHVHVLWRNWESVPERERAEIILEAYKKVKGTIEMLRISVAMGVTPSEASKLGLGFQAQLFA